MQRCHLLPSALLLAIVATGASYGGETPRFALLPAAHRAHVPEWALPGHIRYARCDGGPIEVRKAQLSCWDAIEAPGAVEACEKFYSDQTIGMLQQAHVNWIWVTWSNGFSHETEAPQRAIVKPWIAKCHAAGIHVTAYLSLTNMFIDDMFTHVPASRGWMQVELDGSPQPYSTAARRNGRFTRIIACLNNPSGSSIRGSGSARPSRRAPTGSSTTIVSTAASARCAATSSPPTPAAAWAGRQRSPAPSTIPSPAGRRGRNRPALPAAPSGFSRPGTNSAPSAPPGPSTPTAATPARSAPT